MKNLILKIPGETDYLNRIRSFVLDYAKTLGFNEEALGDIEFGVDEAVTNIIKHSYDEDPDIPEEKRIIEVEVRKIDNGIEIILKDRARPFNPTNVPSPDLDKHVAGFKSHGLGVFAMKTTMDEIEHRYIQGVGNEISLKKYIK